MEIAIIKTPIGLIEIQGNANGISNIHIVKEETPISLEIHATLIDAKNQLEEYFEGNRNQFSLKLNPKGTEFQRKVWQELQQIPFGKTISYLQLSKKLGDLKAIRAVATANGKNPLWIVIPCHRVIGTNGSLTGYAGGLWQKKWLLDHENPVKQETLF